LYILIEDALVLLSDPNSLPSSTIKVYTEDQVKENPNAEILSAKYEMGINLSEKT
jgi:hypothetical protein